jgi:hypothetical protein
MKEGRKTRHKQITYSLAEVNRFKFIMHLKETSHKEELCSQKIINLILLKP